MLLLLFIITIVICIYSYNIAFYSPKRTSDVPYHLPEGKQYKVYHADMQKCIDEMLAQPFEKVTIISHDGLKLYGRYYHVKDGAPVQIQFHGYRSTAVLDFCGGSKLARNCGHNAIVVDQRCHGKSEGRTITFGIEERKDCLDWIRYVRKRFGKDTKIILCGLSMGASTVLMATDLKLPKNVVGIIADCPFSSPKEIIKKVGRDMHLPVSLFYPFVKLSAFLIGKFNLEESSAVEAVKKATIPILIFHGDNDLYVPYQMSQEIASANPNIHFETISGAGHGLCYMTNPEQYKTATMQFIQRLGLTI